MEANEKIVTMRQQMTKTSEGRAMFKDRMVDAFNSLLPAGKDSLGFDEMKKMQDVMAPSHDHLVGGHWIWDEKTAKAGFDFMVGIFCFYLHVLKLAYLEFLVVRVACGQVPDSRQCRLIVACLFKCNDSHPELCVFVGHCA